MDDLADENARPAHLFKKGQSGNPSGRRRSSESLAADVVEVFGSSSSVQVGNTTEVLPTMEHIFLSICEQAFKGSNKHLRIAIETMLTLKPSPGKRAKEEEERDFSWARAELARRLRIEPLPDPPVRLPKEVRLAIREYKRLAKLELARRKRERKEI